MIWILIGSVWGVLCMLVLLFIAGAHFLPDVYAADDVDEEPTTKGEDQ